MKPFVVAFALGLILLTGCSTTVPAGRRPASGASIGRQDDVTVCQHYRTQRAWVKSLTSPNLADALKFATDVGVDAGQTSPGTALHRDLTAMEADQAHTRSVYKVSERVIADCQQLGVTF